MTTGERIKELRTARHMTQKQLADRLGVSKQSVCIWESDRQGISRENVEMICDIFNVSTDYLLGRDDVTPRLLSAEEMHVIDSYREQPEMIKETVCKILDVKRDAESTDSLMEA